MQPLEPSPAERPAPGPAAAGDAPEDERAELPPELLAELRLRGAAEHHPAGAVIVAEGEPALSMYLVEDGELRVSMHGEDGREVELNRLRPGEYFGELMLGSAVRTATVSALTPVRLTQVTRAQFEALLAERPGLALHVIQHLVRRVRALSRDVQGLASMDVYGRIVRLFNDRARDDGGERVVAGPWNLQQIADRVGASRAMVHRILHDLAEGGYVALERRRIVIRKRLPRHW